MRSSKTLRQAVLLLAAAGLLAAVSNVLAGPERRLRWTSGISAPPAASRAAAPVAPAAPSSPSDPSKQFPPHPGNPWVEIDGEDAELLFSRKAPFLDARRSAPYREGHVAGARSMPVWEADVDDRVKALYEEGLDQSQPLVVYCSGGDCEDSHLLGQKLYMVGFDNVLVYRGGFPDWQKRGQPVSTGASP